MTKEYITKKQFENESFGSVVIFFLIGFCLALMCFIFFSQDVLKGHWECDDWDNGEWGNNREISMTFDEFFARVHLKNLEGFNCNRSRKVLNEMIYQRPLTCKHATFTTTDKDILESLK